MSELELVLMAGNPSPATLRYCQLLVIRSSVVATVFTAGRAYIIRVLRIKCGRSGAVQIYYGSCTRDS
jgi:hypothetical protein